MYFWWSYIFIKNYFSFNELVLACFMHSYYIRFYMQTISSSHNVYQCVVFAFFIFTVQFNLYTRFCWNPSDELVRLSYRRHEILVHVQWKICQAIKIDILGKMKRSMFNGCDLVRERIRLKREHAANRIRTHIFLFFANKFQKRNFSHNHNAHSSFHFSSLLLRRVQRRSISTAVIFNSLILKSAARDKLARY